MIRTIKRNKKNSISIKTKMEIRKNKKIKSEILKEEKIYKNPEFD